LTLEPIHPRDSVVTSPRRGFTKACLTGLLAIAALITLGYWGWRGLKAWDTEAMESPLMMSVARQLVVGPGELYGPFGAGNPLVLIHAPLYYRLAALTAWPLYRAGFELTEAARIAGRGLSALSLLATLAVAYRLARLGGGSRLAGWWAALLLAASPLLAGQPFAVRPDMLGIALQSAGLYLILSALVGEGRSNSRILWGYVAFGLALCVKQHLVVEAGICTVFLIWKSRGAGIPISTIARAIAVCALIVTTVYGAEWVITGGEIWNSAFVAARQVGQIYPGGFRHCGLILYAITRRETALLALIALTGLTALSFSSGALRKTIAILGALIYGLIVANIVFNLIYHKSDLEIPAYGIALTAGLCFLGCRLFAREWLDGHWIDAILWLCLAAELAVTLALAYLSTGSWLNYGIQAVVLGSILTARAGARVVEASPSPWALWPMAIGVLAIVLSSYNNLDEAEIDRRYNDAAVETMLNNLKRPANAFFFDESPGFNRISGRLELVYDHWLYRVFESAHLAESRSAWIGQALQSRSLHGVVTSSDQPVLRGTNISLRSFGFFPRFKVGHFYVWLR